MPTILDLTYDGSYICAAFDLCLASLQKKRIYEYYSYAGEVWCYDLDRGTVKPC